MIRGFLGTVLIGLASAGCHHRAPPVMMLGGCSDARPPIGPPGHLELIQSTGRDTRLDEMNVGRFIALLRWSSDSLAKESTPSNAIFHLQSVTASTDTTMFLGPPLQLGQIPTIVVQVVPDSYHVDIRSLGAQRLDTLLSVRRGYSDTLRVFVQAGGLQICS